MEEFEKIDWLPNLEDIIDDQFLDEERMKNESTMYKILNGVFLDPFTELRPYSTFLSYSPDPKAPPKAAKTPKNKKCNKIKKTSPK